MYGCNREIFTWTQNVHGSVVSIQILSNSQMRPAILHKAFWLVFAALLSMAGMWIYASRVLVPLQMHEAAKHDRPRGNLSDLYPRWLGARELLLHGRDPYSRRGHPRNSSGLLRSPARPARPDDPHDEQGFAYPVYVVFCLAPTIHCLSPLSSEGFFWLLVVLTCASTVLLWLRVLRWQTTDCGHGSAWSR